MLAVLQRGSKTWPYGSSKVQLEVQVQARCATATVVVHPAPRVSLATMQQTVGSKLAVYDAMPDAAVPFTLFRFDTPEWLMLPLYALQMPRPTYAYQPK